MLFTFIVNAKVQCNLKMIYVLFHLRENYNLHSTHSGSSLFSARQMENSLLVVMILEIQEVIVTNGTFCFILVLVSRSSTFQFENIMK